MDEPLLNNNNNTSNTQSEKKSLLGFVKKVIQDVNQDMNVLDYTINTLLFGHSFDLLFLEHDHSPTMEWRKFHSQNKPLPLSMREAMLSNDPKLAALYAHARQKSFMGKEEEFWEKWQFYRFLQEQHQKAVRPTGQPNTSKATLLPQHLSSGELEEWD